MKRLISGMAAVPVLVIALSVPALAASNPAGSGQPGTANPNGVACGAANALLQPNGFGTDGFANAAANYAGSANTGSLNSGNSHAISEYDIACYQVSQTP